MIKYLLIICCLAFCIPEGKAQTINDNDREEFITAMNTFAHKQHVVKEIPQFKGGPGALYDYLQQHIVYPPQAKKDNLSAQVFVAFTIDAKTGKAKSVHVIQSSNDKFNSEAQRLIKAMPVWAPATQQDGKNVDMELTVPIYFHLD